jgi:hypothetical protein
MPTDPDPTVDYDASEERPEWQAAVAAWRWEGSEEKGWRKFGPCPRCGHPLAVTEGSVVQGALPVEERTQALALCTCSGEHKNHPERVNKDWGCGFSCQVPLPDTRS